MDFIILSQSLIAKAKLRNIFGSSSGDIIYLSDLLGIDILVFIFLAIIQLVLGLIIIYFKIIKPYFRLKNKNDDKNIEKLDKMV